MELHEFQSALTRLLQRANCPMSERELRRSTTECRDEIYADTMKHGGRIEEPFFNFVIAGNVAVFTFFENAFSIYVLACDEDELIHETNRLAMVEIEPCKLAEKYGRREPDLVLSRSMAEQWMDLG